MIKKTIFFWYFFVCMLFFWSPLESDAHYNFGNAISVEIIGDGLGPLSTYQANSEKIGGFHQYRAFVEAKRGARYSIRVTNSLNRPVGLVISVDGRNIISGQKSYLRNEESMYLLRAYGTCEYDGWRSGEHSVNRFFFSEAAESYAASWGDFSSIGVIAIAVFPEKRRFIEQRISPYDFSRNEHFDRYDKKANLPSFEGKGDCIIPSPSQQSRFSRPGTGYGENKYSPTESVYFEPEPYPIERVYIKYEWHENLHNRAIIQPPSGLVIPWDANPRERFAPPPPHNGSIHRE